MKEILHALRNTGLKSIPRQLWYRQRRKGLRGRIQSSYGANQDPEVREVLAFLNAHPSQELPVGMTPPYDWVRQYRTQDVRVERDSETGMLFAQVAGNRIFFPRSLTQADAQRAICIARMEQDSRSPHSYLGAGHNVDPGDVAVFVGASDGIFCLSLIERLSRAYLFEPDPAWVEPLRATLKPWAAKVEIVPRALGSQDADGIIRLDSFLPQRNLPNFIQMDVEGAEREVLDGAMDFLRKARKLRLSICTYHNRLDYPEFAQILSQLGYHISHSPGYYVLGVRMPYLRRGILYAARGTSS